MKDYKMIKNYRTGGNCKVLFCFPYAGGGASAYRGWIRALDNKVNICPIQLPGRREDYRKAIYRYVSVGQ